MSDLVPADVIETIVGAKRHHALHLARAVSDEQTVYILHSAECLNSVPNLRECPYSIALDRGIDVDDWEGLEDRPIVVVIHRGRLFPVVHDWLRADRGAEA